MSASQQKRLRQQQREQGTEKHLVAQQEAEKKAKKTKHITVAVCAALVVILIAVVLFNSTLFYHAFPAVEIGDTTYNASELSYFYKSAYNNYVTQYSSYLQYMNLDTTKSLDSQDYDENGKTWADFFRETAIDNMTQITAIYNAAVADGYELTEEEKASIDKDFETLAETAKSANLSVNAYLSQVYGKGCNEKLVRKMVEKQMLASSYAQKTNNSFTYSDSELDAYYEENKNSFDNFTYISYFASGAEDTENGIDAETAMANAKELANSVVEGVVTESDFTKSVLAKTETEASPSTTQGSSLSTDYAEWLQDASRKAGDKTVIESSNGYYAVYFISREKNDAKTVSARHILTYVLPNEAGEYTDDAKAEAKAKAEALLTQYEAGDKTEESFAALANENSDDTGSNTNGGLYENFKEGQMVQSFNDWCFDPARKSGDTGIVFNEGSYCGYHVIYFVGQGETYDKVLADQAMRNADYTKWQTSLTDGIAATTTTMSKLVK